MIFWHKGGIPNKRTDRSINFILLDSGCLSDLGQFQDPLFIWAVTSIGASVQIRARLVVICDGGS